MTLSEDEIDGLLYYARSGAKEELELFCSSLCEREKYTLVDLVRAATAENGNGILHMAAANGYSDVVRNLCKSLASVSSALDAVHSLLNAQNRAGNTALHWAALNGHLEVVQALLENGSDPTIRNHRGHDAIFEAELNNKTEIVEWVLKEGGEGLEEGLNRGSGKNASDEESVKSSSPADLNQHIEQMTINTT